MDPQGIIPDVSMDDSHDSNDQSSLPMSMTNQDDKCQGGSGQIFLTSSSGSPNNFSTPSLRGRSKGIILLI